MTRVNGSLLYSDTREKIKCILAQANMDLYEYLTIVTDIERVGDIVERCDILLKKGTAIGSVLIRELTAEGTPFSESYSHCGIYDGNGGVYDARFPESGHFVLDYDHYDVYRVNLTEEQKDKIIQLCEQKKGTKFAVEGIIEEGIERIFHIPVGINLNGEEWCATFVTKIFASAGVPIINKPFPVPNDIAWSVATSKVS